MAGSVQNEVGPKSSPSRETNSCLGPVLLQRRAFAESVGVRSMSESITLITDLIVRLAGVSSTWSKKDLNAGEGVYEACRVMTRERFMSFVRDAASKPILYSYTADCTPMVTREVISRSSSGVSVRRSGKR
eukprot:4276488-Amphidinium_carterae.1